MHAALPSLNCLFLRAYYMERSLMIPVLAMIVVTLLIMLFFLVLFVKCYKRCPSNRILVIYGKTGGERPFRDPSGRSAVGRRL